MVNNIPAAMPQYGVEKADIIFEIPVEGDQTRFMALYADYTTVPQICAIRSCRYYFPALSQGFDAFYVNWGIDDSIADYLEALNSISMMEFTMQRSVWTRYGTSESGVCIGTHRIL